MKKSDIKRMFKAIETGDQTTLGGILDADPGALETAGVDNRFFLDKTPLMYAMQ